MAFFPFAEREFDRKSLAKDARDPEFDESLFINGIDLNRIYEEIEAIEHQLGAYQKYEFDISGFDIIVGSGTSIMDGDIFEFAGGTLTATGTGKVWVSEIGVLTQGPEFPFAGTEAFVPIADLTAVDAGGIADFVDRRQWVDGFTPITADIIVYTPDDPDCWVPPATELFVSEALDQLCARACEIEKVVPPSDPDSIYCLHAQYPQAIVDDSLAPFLIGTTGREPFGPERKQYYQFTVTSGVPNEVVIAVKYQLPGKMTSFDGVSIEVFRSGTVGSLTMSVYNASGTIDPTISGTGIAPATPSVFTDSGFKTTSLTYSPGETITVEIKAVIDDVATLVRFAKLCFDFTQ